MKKPFAKRYKGGEFREVWKNLLELGADVCLPGYRDDAWGVAVETMRRVRRNVATLKNRLQKLGYRFAAPRFNEFVSRKPSERDFAVLAKMEREIGPLPLSVRAYYEIVGPVDFIQDEEQQTKLDDRKPDTEDLCILGQYSPLAVEPIQRCWERRRKHFRNQGRFTIGIVPDDANKGHYSGDFIYMSLPNPNADATVDVIGDDPLEFFVDHLRKAFENGGFLLPNHEGCPKRLLAELAKDLLPM